MFLLSACSKSDSPESPADENSPDEQNMPEEETTADEVYLTINVNQTYHTDQTDNWIIIHNATGMLLDYRAFETGDSMEFKAKPEDITSNLTVTQLTVMAGDQTTTHSFESKTQVPKGTTLDYGTNSPPISPEPHVQLDDFHMTITNIPNPKKMLLSNKFGNLGGLGSGTGNGGLWTFERDVTHLEGADEYIIFIIDAFDNYEYYYLNNPDGADITLDYATDFEVYDQSIEITLPPHNSYLLQTAGFYEADEIGQVDGLWMEDLLSFVDGQVSTDPLKIVYSDRFDKFRTYFNISMDGYTYLKNSFGPAFTDLEIPEKPAFAILDSSLEQFRFETPLTYQVADWQFYISQGSGSTGDYRFTRWIVEANSRYEPVLGPVPQAITDMYPLMDLDGMKFKQIDLYLQKGEELFTSTELITILAN